MMKSISDRKIRTLREDFPSLRRSWQGKPLKFFDGPGGAQVPDQVIEAVSSYYRTCNANSHGLFLTSRETDRVLEDARMAMADFLNAPGAENISFGANMTTLNYALSHALVREMRPGDEIVITALDHEANRGPWLGLRERGIEIREVPATGDGRLNYRALESLVNDRTRLVAVGWASNALGTVNDIALIRETSRRHGALLLVDAVHYAPHLPIDVQSMNPDFLLCSAYKFYGPHVGILYSKTGLLEQLEPDRLKTQDQQAPFRIETGTLNHAAIAGVSAAVNYLAQIGSGSDRRSRIVDGMSQVSDYEFALGRRLYESLAANPSIDIYGPPFPEDPGDRTPTVSFRVKGLSPSQTCERLAEDGFLLWDGDFYAARIVELMGLADRGGLVRAGISIYTLPEEVESLLEAVGMISS